jgi:hypothetical protein
LSGILSSGYRTAAVAYDFHTLWYYSKKRAKQNEPGTKRKKESRTAGNSTVLQKGEERILSPVSM